MQYRERLPDATRAALFALLPAAANGGGMALAVMVGLAGVLAFRPSRLRQALETRPLPLGLLLLALAWTAASCLWSDFHNHIQALKLAATVLLGLVFADAAVASAEARRMTRAAAIAAAIVLMVLLSVEAIWRLPLNHAAQPGVEFGLLERNTDHGVTILLSMAWAVAATFAAAGRWRAAATAPLLVVTGVLAGQFHDDANLAAFAFGLVAFALAFLRPRTTVFAVTGGLAAWLLTAPFATPLLLSSQRLVDALPLSWAVRVGIWRYVCAHIPERFWLGHGLDASRTVTDRIIVRTMDLKAIPLHPHSASLQIWYETGAIGALLFASALVAGGFALAGGARESPARTAAACATLASLGVIANVSYGLWQEWWGATMLIAAAVIGAIASRPQRAG